MITKQDIIIKEINEHEEEIKRLQRLLIEVKGDALKVCPNCKTKNYHWNTNNSWCCACC